MSRFANELKILSSVALFAALQLSASVLASEADIPASFNKLNKEQQTACIELDALNRTHKVECLEERLWRLEHRAFKVPSTTSKPVRERIKALAAELTPSEEIIEEVRTRMAKTKGGKLPPDLIRSKSGIREVDANEIDTNSSSTTGMRSSDGNSAGYAKLSDQLNKLESTMAKLKKIAQGDAAASEVDGDSSQDQASAPTDEADTGIEEQHSRAEEIGEAAPQSGEGDRSSTGTSASESGWTGEHNLPGEQAAKSADALEVGSFAELNPSQQLAALEIEHHDKLGAGKTESRLRQLEIEIMGADYVAGGKSEAARLKALNASSPASTLSIKRAIKVLKNQQ